VTVTHAGNGPDVIRQDKAHAHCVRITPDGQFLCIADLGLDRVLAYDWSRRRDGLSPVAALTITTAPGAGPRHLVFHPNGRFAFLLNELNNTLTSYRYTGDAFIPLHTRSTLPSDFHAFSKAAALTCSADGRRLLASNRGHDSIAAFDVDPDSGRLNLLTISTLAGAGPRDFAFTPGEAFILAGHETSNTVCSYAYDAASGRLEPACDPHPIHRPVCIVFGQPVIEPALNRH
jgi:6-phosphogluconolactonase